MAKPSIRVIRPARHFGVMLDGIAGAGVRYLIVSGKADFTAGGFASNGYAERSPAGFAPLAIGLGLTLIHLISIPVTNTSVNPARSIAAAIFATDGGSARSGCSSSPH